MLMSFQPISANFSLFSWLENQLNPTGFPGFHCLKNPLNSACFLGRKINIIQLVFLTEKSDIFLANISATVRIADFHYSKTARALSIFSILCLFLFSFGLRENAGFEANFKLQVCTKLMLLTLWLQFGYQTNI